MAKNYIIKHYALLIGILNDVGLQIQHNFEEYLVVKSCRIDFI